MKTTVLTLDATQEYQVVQIGWSVASLGRAYLGAEGQIECVAVDLEQPVDPDVEPPQQAVIERGFFVLGTDVEVPAGTLGGYWGSVRMADGSYRHVWA